MAMPTDPSASCSTDKNSTQGSCTTAPQHPRGYTLADEELERLEEKRKSGNVLDPIALNDPVGHSVEKVIMRVGIAVVSVLIVGILLAQVMCKNIQMMGVPDFSTGTTVEQVEKALGHGILWGGDTVRFPAVEDVALQGDTVVVTVDSTSVKTLEQLVAVSQDQATALAMNLFRDPEIASVVYMVRSNIDPETGAFSAKGDEQDEVITITWRRSDTTETYICSLAGFVPTTETSSARIAQK